MKPYPEYQNSGYPWLGIIPKQWELKKLKYLVALKNQPAIESLLSRLCIDLENIEGWTGKTIKTGQEQKAEGAKSFSANDVLFSKLRPYLAKVYRATEPGVCGGEFLVLTPSTAANPDFLFFTLVSERFINVINGSTYGIKMPRASWDFIGNLPVPFSNEKEQKNIALYLYRKTALLDDLISKKEKLIKLLKEESAATIRHAVTKGLNPEVELKEASTPWLSKVPKHWSEVRLRFLCDITTGGKDTENREADGIFPFFVRSQTVERISTYSFDGEAVLTAGDGVGVGKVFHYYKGKLDFHQRVYMFYNFKKVVGQYFFYYLKMNLDKVVCRGDAKSTVDSIRLPFLQDFPVVFPDVAEQEEIVSYINSRLKKSETQIENEEKSVELLKEYRTALISEVVTGKIDVREI